MSGARYITCVGCVRRSGGRVPLCALGEFSRVFMMATMMSGLFICGQTDHSNTEIQIGPAVPGTECSAASVG